MSATTSAIGQLLAGKYRLEASIGRGGMGEVFSASHAGTGARVAVKVVSRALLGDVLMARLHREALAAGRIQSDFIPRVFDVDRTADGELFLVMELLRGESLAERIKRGPLSWDEVRRLGEDVLCGLMDAHAAGVVHRDLKPGNIFVETVTTGGHVTRERARILDFGVCKFDAPDAEKLTITGEAVGTVSYMAPEQIRGASKVDERADLYSFGLVVFEALSGRLPYDAQGQIALLASKLEKPARGLKDLTQVAIPPGLDALVAKALARKPADRFASASEMLAAWRALGAATLAPRALPIVSNARVVAPLSGGLTTGTVNEIAYQSRGSRLGLFVAAGVLVAASVVLAAVLRSGPATASAPAAVTTTTEASADPASGGDPRAEAIVASAAATVASAASAPATAASAAAAPASSAPSDGKSDARTDGKSAPRTRAPRRAKPSAAPRRAVADPASGAHITTEPRY